jgi:hypothetical protein
MPSTIISKSFNSIAGTFGYYKNNVGDSSTVTLVVVENIRFDSVANTLTYNPTTKTISVSGASWLDEGFRIGDEITITIYDSSTSTTTTQTRIINALTPSGLVHSGAILSWYTAPNQTLSIIVKYKTNEKRNGLLLDINHVRNSTGGSEFSLIDGEVTRQAIDLTATITNEVRSGVPIGNESGQFITVVSMEDLTTYPNDLRTYEITLGVINSGVFDSQLFDFSDCLKLFLKFNWQRTYGDPNNMTITSMSDGADTGFFDQAFNNGVIDATLVQGINELYFDTVSSGQISIDSSALQLGFGACYIPTLDAYYKNQPYNQSELTLIAPTQNAVSPITISNAFTNPQNAGYTITFSNPTTIGTVTTWDYTFTPDNDFGNFMASRDVGDRLFYVWARYGSVNLLLFGDQLKQTIKQGDPLNMVVHDFTDHSQNYNDTNIVEAGFSGNVEDDLAFIGKFIVPINSDITNVSAIVEAYDSVTNDKFTIQSVNFDFTNVPLVFGYYPINQSQLLFSILENTNVKREASLIRDNSVDTISEYGFKIFIPIIYNWRYWLPQNNADAQFYPNEQTQNWIPYDNTANWNLRLKISANIDGLESTYEEDVTLLDYDSEPLIDQDIQLIRDLDNTNVGVVIEGELMRVVAEHTLTDPLQQWLIPSVWGMITIEPKEGAPRWQSSTIVPYDNNTLNPLSPISGLFCSLTFPSPNVARMECYFDSTKINLSNGVKFTTKIKGCVIEYSNNFKLKTDGSIKLTTYGLPKILS